MNSLAKFVLDHGGADYNLVLNNNMLETKYAGSTPTCLWRFNKLLINIRVLDYNKIYQDDRFDVLGTGINQTYVFNRGGFTSRNMVIYMDGNSQTKEIGMIKYPESQVDAYYKGLEDCKYVEWDNKLYAYGTRWDRIADKGCMCIYELNDELEPVNEIVTKNPNGTTCEKNWGAIEDMPFTFIYTVNPTRIVKVDRNGNCTFIKEIKQEGVSEFDIKGSTCVVRYSNDEYISLVHSTKYGYENGVHTTKYYTAFVFYDNNFRVTRMSDWFVFKSDMCEFTCGLAIHNDDVYITYSQLDCTSNVLKTNKDTIEKFINNHDNLNNTYDSRYYHDLAFEYENHNQILAANVLYNYAAFLGIRDGMNPNDRLECVIRTFGSVVKKINLAFDSGLIDDLIKSINKQLVEHPDTCEFYYMLSNLYRIKGDIVEAKRNLELGDKTKYKIHNYFFKYINPNYL